MTMNERAWILADALAANAQQFQVAVSHVAGARLIDCGVDAVGGEWAGTVLARICTGDLMTIAMTIVVGGTLVRVHSSDPVRACLGAQYAGWKIAAGNYFAMGSGPMRAAAGSEVIFQHIHCREMPTCAVGVLETRKMPTEDAIAIIRAKLPPSVDKLTLLVAPAASVCGNIQVVSRSLETALHKLHELKFDVSQIRVGSGSAPLPPVAADEIQAIGRTNDAILYGGRVHLQVDCDDAAIEEIGPRVPSNASKDHGVLFMELYARYGDFYKIDPLLFSPAEVTFENVDTGHVFRYGKCEPDLVRKSFGDTV